MRDRADRTSAGERGEDRDPRGCERGDPRGAGRRSGTEAGRQRDVAHRNCDAVGDVTGPPVEEGRGGREPDHGERDPEARADGADQRASRRHDAAELIG
jgi:hypothetical protein